MPLKGQGAEEPSEFASLPVPKLKELLKAAGQPVSGTKKELIERLEELNAGISEALSGKGESEGSTAEPEARVNEPPKSPEGTPPAKKARGSDEKEENTPDVEDQEEQEPGKEKKAAKEKDKDTKQENTPDQEDQEEQEPGKEKKAAKQKDKGTSQEKAQDKKEKKDKTDKEKKEKEKKDKKVKDEEVAAKKEKKDKKAEDEDVPAKKEKRDKKAAEEDVPAKKDKKDKKAEDEDVTAKKEKKGKKGEGEDAAAKKDKKDKKNEGDDASAKKDKRGKKVEDEAAIAKKGKKDNTHDGADAASKKGKRGNKAEGQEAAAKKEKKDKKSEVEVEESKKDKKDKKGKKEKEAKKEEELWNILGANQVGMGDDDDEQGPIQDDDEEGPDADADDEDDERGADEAEDVNMGEGDDAKQEEKNDDEANAENVEKESKAKDADMVTEAEAIEIKTEPQEASWEADREAESSGHWKEAADGAEDTDGAGWKKEHKNWWELQGSSGNDSADGKAAEPKAEPDLDLGRDGSWHLLENNSLRKSFVEKLCGVTLDVDDNGGVRVGAAAFKADEDRALLVLKVIEACRSNTMLELTSAPVENDGRCHVVRLSWTAYEALWTGGQSPGLLTTSIAQHSAAACCFTIACSEADEKKNEAEDADDKADDGALEAGQKIEAKYGSDEDRLFEATVVEVWGENVKVKYAYDGSEAEVLLENIRRLPEPARDEANKKAEDVGIIVVGQDRERWILTTLVWSHCEAMAPSSITSSWRPPSQDDDREAACAVAVELIEDGKYRGRIVGYQQMKRKALTAATNTFVEFVGRCQVVAVGTREERAAFVGILQAVQRDRDRETPVPPMLLPHATVVAVRKESLGTVFFMKAALLNRLEADLSVYIAQCAPSGGSNLEPMDLAVGLKVEGNYGGKWFEATVLEVQGSGAKVQWAYDATSEAELQSWEIRAILEGEALAARERQEKMADGKMFAIVGRRPNRAAAALQIMKAVEAKRPGTYSASVAGIFAHGEDFGAETLKLEWQDLQALQGAAESVLTRIAAAIGCALDLLGDTVFFVGSPEERVRAREYLSWLLASLKHEEPHIPNVDQREDISYVEIPEDKKCNLPDRVIEPVDQEFQTYSVFGRSEKSGLLVCGRDGQKRASAVEKFKELQDVGPNAGWGSGGSAAWGSSSNNSAAWGSGGDKWWEKSSGDKSWDSWGSGGSEKRAYPSDKEKTASNWDAWGAQKTSWGNNDGDWWKETHSGGHDKGGDDKWWDKGQSSWDKGGEATWDNTQPTGPEKRIHPSDKTRKAYTWEQFVGFSGGDKNKAEEMWNVSTPSQPSGGGSSGSSGDWDRGDKRGRDSGADWGDDGGWSKRQRNDENYVPTWNEMERQREPAPPAEPAGGYSSGQVDTRSRVAECLRNPQMRMPHTLDEWFENQDFFFGGHPPLPDGWVRVWSGSRQQEYYAHMTIAGVSCLSWGQMLDRDRELRTYLPGLRPAPI